MIYLRSEGKSIVILEPANIDRMKKGEPVVTPDKSILIAYTPDAVRFGEEMQKGVVNLETREIDTQRFDDLLKEALNWPEVSTRPYHPLKQVLK